MDGRFFPVFFLSKDGLLAEGVYDTTPGTSSTAVSSGLARSGHLQHEERLGLDHSVGGPRELGVDCSE